MDKQKTTHDICIQNPLIFGEVLFDEFEDGSAILGGAPFNVAWHLQGFGLRPIFVTKIGNDRSGKKVLETMRRWHMQTCGVQVDDDHPTGKVSIKLEQGQPTFSIIPNQAYDNIDDTFDNIFDNTFDNTRNNGAFTTTSAFDACPLLYHGTLALRNSRSRNTLVELQKKYTLPTFVDINLRDPWWDEKIIQQSLGNATWAKLNDIELGEIAKLININHSDQQETATQLRKHFSIALLIVTLGADGAFFISENKTYFGNPVPVNNMVDTVGAGDAFSAVTILGLLNKWPVDVISHRAMSFAANICEMRGATTTDKNFYNKILASWDLHHGKSRKKT